MSRHESFIDFKADNKAIVKNAINSVVIQVIFRMKGLITMPIMTYYLLPKEMGVFNLLVIKVHLLTPLFSKHEVFPTNWTMGGPSEGAFGDPPFVTILTVSMTISHFLWTGRKTASPEAPGVMNLKTALQRA